VFEPNEAANLFAERMNVIDWIVMFNRLARGELAALRIISHTKYKISRLWLAKL